MNTTGHLMFIISRANCIYFFQFYSVTVDENKTLFSVTIDENNTYVTSDNFELKTEDGKPLFVTGSQLNFDGHNVKNLHAPAIDVGSVSIWIIQ